MFSRKHDGTNSTPQLIDESSFSLMRPDYINLVDYYYCPPSAPDNVPLPSLSGPPPSPSVFYETEPRPEEPPPQPSPPGEEQQETAKKLKEALRPADGSHDTIFELYQALPAPRVSYLPRRRVRLLLQRLSVVERKTEKSMLRFLSVVEDMKEAGMPLTVAEWSSAISFAGRCFGKVLASDVESALYLFKEMEEVAGIKANHVTFNILFDMATKAGKYVLAEMMLKEMEARGIGLHRHARVGQIYYHGVRGDGEGVRMAYRRLVEAGEIVDTVVLNCVMASLLKAGETSSAEHVYEGMKRLHAERVGVELPPPQWRDARDLGKALDRAAKRARTDPRAYRQMQTRSAIAPDLQSYRILISHHATESGELERIGPLLHEMRFYEVELHGSIFLALMTGFFLHGGTTYTAWTRQKLESVWSAYLLALDEGVAELYMGKWLVVWTLRAFAKCAGKERALEVWEDAQRRWQPGEGELAMVNQVMRGILRGNERGRR
ncbi:MAG: hypothetical protein M1832_000033 [Thelocarpon impressellum]|nr:MAG: hypothetical protein M1832_000033 [Thelocarpon impressellum]